MTSVALPVAARLPRGLRAVSWIGVFLGLLGAWIALPPISARSWAWSLVVCLIAVMLGIGVVIRGERRFGGYAIAAGVLGFVLAYMATLSGIGKLETVVVWSALFASMLRFATPLAVRRDRRHVQRALRRHEHRARGDDADRGVLRHPRRRQARDVVARPARRDRRGRRSRPCSTPSSRSTSAPTRSSVERRSTSSRSA